MPELVVLHYTAMQSTQAALARLCDPDFEVSAHYLISEKGDVYQLVGEGLRAWHAGAGSWGGRGDVNSRSIGIELANNARAPFSAPQMGVLEALLAEVLPRWGIAPEGVIAHSDMAPGRKSDPGAAFDWRRLARAGFSVWPEEVTPEQVTPEPAAIPGRFHAAATAFGYPRWAADADVLQAFRLRFRPMARGPVDGQDVAMIENLVRRFAVDPAPCTA